MKLAYKAWNPIKIFQEGKVRVSILDGRDRGLSMTTNLQESGHGPFMIVFKEDLPWYRQFSPCLYGVPPQHRDHPRVRPQLYKPEFFSVEQEWWSEHSVDFSQEDVEKVVFMADSPATRIHPCKTKKEAKDFARLFPEIAFLTDTRRYPVE